jgi:hypothetical protein
VSEDRRTGVRGDNRVRGMEIRWRTAEELEENCGQRAAFGLVYLYIWDLWGMRVRKVGDWGWRSQSHSFAMGQTPYRNMRNSPAADISSGLSIASLLGETLSRFYGDVVWISACEIAGEKVRWGSGHEGHTGNDGTSLHGESAVTEQVCRPNRTTISPRPLPLCRPDATLSRKAPPRSNF